MNEVLKVEGLDKSFGGFAVINNVSFSLNAGARHALIGPNGAGKTTLVSLLSGALSADAGRIDLMGRDITAASPRVRVKGGLVRTFQVNNLFDGLTVQENVLLAVSERSNTSGRMFQVLSTRRDLIEESRAILVQLGLEEYADRKITELPYGAQRLVEIAIALSLRPMVLLLDEPAAGITGRDASRLLDIIDGLPAEIAVLMIEHDMHVVRRFAAEVTVLVAGSILMSGKPEEVMGSPEVHRVYLGEDRQKRHHGERGHSRA